MPVQIKAAPSARSTFMWELELEGPNGLFDTALVQTVNLPQQNVEMAEIAQGGQGYNREIAVGYSSDDLELSKLKPADEADTDAWAWLLEAYNPVTGRLGRPADYKFRASVHLLDNDMERLETYIFEGVSIRSINIPDQDARNKDLMMEELVLAVDRRIA